MRQLQMATCLELDTLLGHGGRIGIIFKKPLKLKITTLKNFNSFEYLKATLKSTTKVLRVIIIYRPPASKINTSSTVTFFSEFTTLLELLIPGRGCAELLISCDFNYHVDDHNNKQAIKFLQILHSFDLSQHVDVAIHRM